VTPTATPTALPSGTLDHFLCYRARKAWGQARFQKEEGVLLSDQFPPDRTVELPRIVQFCDAVDKNGEGIIDSTAHLTCYTVGRPVPRSTTKPQVITTDQFGDHALTVRKQRTELCVPSEATVVWPTATPAVSPTPTATPTGSPAPALEHFELYRARRTPRTPTFKRRSVDLTDPFMGLDETVSVMWPARLGVPTARGDGGITNDVTHLTCYGMRAPRFLWRDVEVTNQFHPDGYRLTVTSPNLLCVPSYKLVISEE
jgi:hypothetical protein